MRTPAQRRAAALAELARRAVGADPGRPTIAVTISVEDLQARSGSGRVDQTGVAIAAETRAAARVRRQRGAGRDRRCERAPRRRAWRAAPCRPRSAEPSPSATAVACSRAATGRRAGATGTTSSIGPRAGPPISPTWPSCAITTTRPCTKAAGRWPAPPTAAWRSRDPTARPCSRRDSRAERARPSASGDTMGAKSGGTTMAVQPTREDQFSFGLWTVGLAGARPVRRRHAAAARPGRDRAPARRARRVRRDLPRRRPRAVRRGRRRARAASSSGSAPRSTRPGSSCRW